MSYRVRTTFEPVETPEADENGQYWYAYDTNRTIVCCVADASEVKFIGPSSWLRRKVEPVEPPKRDVWEGEAELVVGECQTWYAEVSTTKAWTFMFVSRNHHERYKAEADMEVLKGYAEDYAARHNAEIEWKDGNR